MRKIYLASPFFNEKQIDRVETLLKNLKESGFKVFSPMHDSKFKLSATPSKEDAMEVFNDNIKNIDESGAVVAIIDERDSGTEFEIGYARSIGKQVLYMCFDPESDHKERLGYIKVDHSDIYYDVHRMMNRLRSCNKNSDCKSALFVFENEDDISSYMGSNPSSMEDTLHIKVITSTMDRFFEFDQNVDYIVISRKGKSYLSSYLWGAAYGYNVPVIGLGSDAAENLMLHPSTVAICNNLEEVDEFIKKTRSMKKEEVINKYRKYGNIKAEVI